MELTPFLLPELGTRALAQRDLPAWGLPARPWVSDRLLHMLAMAHGQLWNATAVGQSLGLSYHTVNGYLDYLEGAYLIRRLPPWSGNLRKRLTRSPKVYLRDTGLLHALLRIGSRTELLRHPAAGASWEGFVIEQLLGTLAASGMDAGAHFLRTSDGYEIDLLLALGGVTVAIEIKLAAHATPQDLARLERAADLVSAEHRYVVCQTAEPAASGTRGALDLASAIERLRKLGRARN